MQRDLLALQSQQAESLKNSSAQQARLEEQLQAADRKIAEMTRVLEDLNRASRSTNVDFGVQLERLTRELQELRGSFELADHRLGKLEKQLSGMAPAEGVVASPVASDPAVPQGKKELFASAAELVKKGKLTEARGIYRELLTRWPNEAGTTDQAYFRLGDTYYSEKKYTSALQEYIKVVEKYPRGAYAADAYYKIGMCSLSIGNLEDAKIFFGEVVRNYKSSPLVKEAGKKLADVQSRLDKERRGKPPPKAK